MHWCGFKVIYLDFYLNKKSFIYFEYCHRSKVRNELLNKKLIINQILTTWWLKTWINLAIWFSTISLVFYLNLWQARKNSHYAVPEPLTSSNWTYDGTVVGWIVTGWFTTTGWTVTVCGWIWFTWGTKGWQTSSIEPTWADSWQTVHGVHQKTVQQSKVMFKIVYNST